MSTARTLFRVSFDGQQGQIPVRQLTAGALRQGAAERFCGGDDQLQTAVYLNGKRLPDDAKLDKSLTGSLELRASRPGCARVLLRQQGKITDTFHAPISPNTRAGALLESCCERFGLSPAVAEQYGVYIESDARWLSDDDGVHELCVDMLPLYVRMRCVAITFNDVLDPQNLLRRAKLRLAPNATVQDAVMRIAKLRGVPDDEVRDYALFLPSSTSVFGTRLDNDEQLRSYKLDPLKTTVFFRTLQAQRAREQQRQSQPQQAKQSPPAPQARATLQQPALMYGNVTRASAPQASSGGATLRRMHSDNSNHHHRHHHHGTLRRNRSATAAPAERAHDGALRKSSVPAAAVSHGGNNQYASDNFVRRDRPPVRVSRDTAAEQPRASLSRHSSRSGTMHRGLVRRGSSRRLLELQHESRGPRGSRSSRTSRTSRTSSSLKRSSGGGTPAESSPAPTIAVTSAPADNSQSRPPFLRSKGSASGRQPEAELAKAAAARANSRSNSGINLTAVRGGTSSASNSRVSASRGGGSGSSLPGSNRTSQKRLSVEPTSTMSSSPQRMLTMPGGQYGAVRRRPPSGTLEGSTSSVPARVSAGGGSGTAHTYGGVPMPRIRPNGTPKMTSIAEGAQAEPGVSNGASFYGPSPKRPPSGQLYGPGPSLAEGMYAPGPIVDAGGMYAPGPIVDAGGTYAPGPMPAPQPPTTAAAAPPAPQRNGRPASASHDTARQYQELTLAKEKMFHPCIQCGEPARSFCPECGAKQPVYS